MEVGENNLDEIKIIGSNPIRWNQKFLGNIQYRDYAQI